MATQFRLIILNTYFVLAEPTFNLSGFLIALTARSCCRVVPMRQELRCLLIFRHLLQNLLIQIIMKDSRRIYKV